MKKLFSLIALMIAISIAYSFHSSNELIEQSTTSIYDIKINSLDGDPIDLNDFKGKKILFVNVASECGYTPQYEDLQTLHENYLDNLIVIAIPCNQFGEQEPGEADEIMEFCQKKYGVTFILTQKVDVKGDDQHSLYAWLTQKDLNGVNNSSVKWNFQKYLVDENGEYVDFFLSATGPLDSKITELVQL